MPEGSNVQSRDHGGNLAEAMTRFGGAPAGWVDLSTGINPFPYPVPSLAPEIWQRLPEASAEAALKNIAKAAYNASGEVCLTSGAQQAIDVIPTLYPKGRARVLGPTYNEHAAALRRAGWRVDEVERVSDLRGADLAVIVNPNNPDGWSHRRHDLLSLKDAVDILITDESFVDPTPEISIAAESHRSGLWVLRSFGKFYGLAGLRLGFTLSAPAEARLLREHLGPWPVNGPALVIGAQALGDSLWRDQMILRLEDAATRLDQAMPLPCIGGTSLFRLYRVPNPQHLQDFLAERQIWTRIFPWSPSLIRLGLPPDAAAARVAKALQDYRGPQ